MGGISPKHSIFIRGLDILRKKGIYGLTKESVKYLNNWFQRREKIAKKREITNNYEDSPKYLNVGGGEFVRDHWRVLDYPGWDVDKYNYESEFIDYITDLEANSNWNIDSNSFDLVYSSHTLEHLSDEAINHTLSEIHRVLKPTGGLRLNVPDSNIAAYHYDSGNREWFQNILREDRPNPEFSPENNDCPEGYEIEYQFITFFAHHLTWGGKGNIKFQEVRENWNKMKQEEFFNFYTNKIQDQWQRENPGYHRNWLTSDRLKNLLVKNGFSSISESKCRQSRFIELCAEDFDKRPHFSLYMDAEK